MTEGEVARIPAAERVRRRRLVVTLRDEDHLSFSAIARVLGWYPTTVKRLYAERRDTIDDLAPRLRMAMRRAFGADVVTAVDVGRRLAVLRMAAAASGNDALYPRGPRIKNVTEASLQEIEEWLHACHIMPGPP